jgi:hypothetical protein
MEVRDAVLACEFNIAPSKESTCDIFFSRIRPSPIVHSKYRSTGASIIQVYRRRILIRPENYGTSMHASAPSPLPFSSSPATHYPDHFFLSLNRFSRLSHGQVARFASASADRGLSRGKSDYKSEIDHLDSAFSLRMHRGSLLI